MAPEETTMSEKVMMIGLPKELSPHARAAAPVVMEEVRDLAALAQAQARREHFERNWAWFEAHAAEVYAAHRGQCVCIAGGELFVADSPEQALALAAAAVRGGNPLDVALVNAVRQQYLGLAPVREVMGEQGLAVVIDLLRSLPEVRE